MSEGRAMNEDLKWLAENEHVWQEGAEYVGRSVMGYCLWFDDDDSIPAGVDAVFMKPEWQAARDELSGKPGWELAPKSAKIRVQQDDGQWFFGSGVEATISTSGGWFIKGHGKWLSHRKFQGRVLGDWRKTLERRPEPVAEPDPKELDYAIKLATASGDHLRAFALSQIRAAADCTITDDDVREVFINLVTELDDEALAGVAGRVVK